MGSAGSALLNLIALTIAASRVDLRDLDVYFIYRDAAESILKLLFISQIGPVCVAALRANKAPELVIRKVIIFGGIFTALILTCLLLVFPHFSTFFLRSESLHLITGFSVLELAILIFFLLTWLDAIATTVLVQRSFFLQNHIFNTLNAALLCLQLAFQGDLTVTSMASAYAISKIAGTLPKILICCLQKSNEVVQDSQSIYPIISVRGTSELNSIISMVFTYTPSNILLLANKFSYLAGSAFLAPGFFAIYNIYYRYYTALQNLITVNIFNLSASRLTCPESAQRETVGLLYRHTLSFLVLYSGASVVLFLCSLPVVQLHLPEFLNTSYASLLWSVILLNFLPDGINFILSRGSMLQNDLKFDSRLNSLQAIANLAVLYPSMRFFGIGGLVYATMLICVIFAAIRLWHFHRNAARINKALSRMATYGMALFILSLSSLMFPAWFYCLATFSLSGLFLIHLLYVLRLEKYI